MSLQDVLDFTLRAGVPVFLAALSYLLLGWGAAREGGAWGGRASVLALAIGYGVGQARLAGLADWPWEKSFPPPSTDFRIYYLIVAVALLGWWEAGSSAGLLIRAPLRLALSVGAAWWVLLNIVRQREPDERWILVASLGAAFTLVWCLAAELERRRPTPTRSLGLSIWATLLSIALLKGSSAMQAQYAAALSAALTAVFAAGLLVRRVQLGRGALGVALVLGGALCTMGVWLSSLPPVAGILLAVAPLGAWLSELPPLRRTAAGRVAAELVGVAALAGAGLAVAWVNAPPPNPYY